MTDRPIIFSAPMVLALLDGRKTQTRRVGKNNRIQVGDRLWVRESFCWGSDGEAGAKDFQIFRANYDGDADKMLSPWKPSIDMPRYASRLTLTVTDVRIQPLQDISEDDAAAEGVGSLESHVSGTPSVSHIQAFCDVWDGINDKRGFGWDLNPWVTAYTFTVRKGNIDHG